MKTKALARLRQEIQEAGLAPGALGRQVQAVMEGRDGASDAALRVAWWLGVGASALDPAWIAVGPMMAGELASGARGPEDVLDALDALPEGEVPGLDRVTAATGEALSSLVRGAVGEVAGRHLSAWFERARNDARRAARAGDWDRVPVDGPDAVAVRMALRFLPVEDALAVLEAWWEAEDLQNQEDWAGAAAALGRAGKVAPNLFETWVRRARVHAARQDRFAAAADVERALSLNARSATARAMRAELRLLIRDLAGSLQDWDEAIATAPEHGPFYLRRAYTRMAAGRTAEAAADADRAVSLSPQDLTARFARADLKVRARDFAAAVADYDAILAVDPDEGQALLNRATARLMMREPAAARVDLDRLVGLRPTEGLAWLRRSMAALQAGDPWPAWVDALTALALAVEEGPVQEQAGELLRRAYHDLSPQRPADPSVLAARFELAGRVGLPLVRMAELLGQHLPGEGYAWHALRAEALRQGRKPAEAASAWRDALAVEGRPEARLGLARALREAGRPGEALVALGEVHEADRDARWAFEEGLATAQAAALEGRLADAVAAFEGLLTRWPERAELWFSLGVHRSLTGDGAGAEAAYTEAVTRQPGFAVAWYNRGCERARLGRDDEALADLTQAFALDGALVEEARGDAFLDGLRASGRLGALLAVADGA